MTSCGVCAVQLGVHSTGSHSSSVVWGTFCTDCMGSFCFLFCFCGLSSQKPYRHMYSWPVWSSCGWKLGVWNCLLTNRQLGLDSKRQFWTYSFPSCCLLFTIPFFLGLEVTSTSIKYLVSQTEIFFLIFSLRANTLNTVDNVKISLFGLLVSFVSHAQGLQVAEVCCPYSVCRNWNEASKN